MLQFTTAVVRLLALTSFCAHCLASAVALSEPQDDEPLSYSPGDVMVVTTSTPTDVGPSGSMAPTDSSLSFNPGGPMLPETPVSEPAPTPMSVQPGGPLKPPRAREEDPRTTPIPTPTLGRAPGKSCTWTTSEIVPYPCSFDGVETIYLETETSTNYVDCHGCLAIQVDKQIWYCPIQIVNTTRVALTPKTTWTTACAPLTLPGGTTAWGAAPSTTARLPVSTVRPLTAVPDVMRRNPQSILLEYQPAKCPTTFVVQPRQTAGSTSTHYQQIVTSTVKLPCGGCPLVISTALAGYGPAGRFTATVTVPVGTITTYACQ